MASHRLAHEMALDGMRRHEMAWPGTEMILNSFVRGNDEMVCCRTLSIGFQRQTSGKCIPHNLCTIIIFQNTLWNLSRGTSRSPHGKQSWGSLLPFLFLLVGVFFSSHFARK